MTMNEVRVIVIINDDADDVNLLKRSLVNDAGENYRFIVADSGVKGIQASLSLAERPPDCVIVDLHLPDMGGMDVLNGLKDEAGDIRVPVVLFIDTGDQCKAASAALRSGAEDYIAKSWMTPDGLACAVENAIERFRLRERLRKRADAGATGSRIQGDRRKCA